MRELMKDRRDYVVVFAAGHPGDAALLDYGAEDDPALPGRSITVVVTVQAFRLRR
ncbi:hypothetical protein ACFWFI_31315 [Streptomyces sp. NPDC060209]|uniref:hypothetical protein n=1 Tax=Streptomyces sp. NPDC060209 TaxID=3347073 RepID=UPI0036513CE9